MALTFRIFPERGLVLARFGEVVTMEGLRNISREYTAHPDYAAGQKQLIDLSQLKSYEKNYVQIMQLQAIKTGRFVSAGVQSLGVYFAPTPIAQDFANLLIQPWANVPNVIAMVQASQAEALALLGQPEDSIVALLIATDNQRTR